MQVESPCDHDGESRPGMSSNRKIFLQDVPHHSDEALENLCLSVHHSLERPRWDMVSLMTMEGGSLDGEVSAFSPEVPNSLTGHTHTSSTEHYPLSEHL